MTTTLILKATAGDLQGKQFHFTQPSYCVLGRSRSCTLRLSDDATVSRQHCLLELDADGVWVQDLGSLNGTFVNGTKVGQREAQRDGDTTMVQPPRQCLRDGDLLRIGNNVFAVRVITAAVAPQGQDSEYERAIALWKAPGRQGGSG
jgi:eukaryotic-like serine/threonine-protein kinase